MKSYGIRIRLPSGDPMAGAHLLGPDWQSHRWYETAEERDAALAEMRREHPWSRRGDRPSQVLERVER